MANWGHFLTRDEWDSVLLNLDRNDELRFHTLQGWRFHATLFVNINFSECEIENFPMMKRAA